MKNEANVFFILLLHGIAREKRVHCTWNTPDVFPISVFSSASGLKRHGRDQGGLLVCLPAGLRTEPAGGVFHPAISFWNGPRDGGKYGEHCKLYTIRVEKYNWEIKQVHRSCFCSTSTFL